MENIMSLIMALLIIYSFLIGFTVLLVSKLYRSYFVCGTKTKEIVRPGNFTYPDGDSNDKVTSYFNFKTKSGININRGTSAFPMTKKGKKKYFLYNEDRNEIVAGIYTLIWQFLIFGISLLYSAMVDFIFFIIAIVLVIITICLYKKNYDKKHLNRSKK